MLNNFLYFSVPWDAWDDDVSCKWPHLCKKKIHCMWPLEIQVWYFMPHQLIIEKNRKEIELEHWTLYDTEPALLIVNNLTCTTSAEVNGPTAQLQSGALYLLGRPHLFLKTYGFQGRMQGYIVGSPNFFYFPPSKVKNGCNLVRKWHSKFFSIINP